MLNNDELCEIENFVDTLSLVREKKLLKDLLFEYREYIRCGTVEDCEQRKEWMGYSIDDIRENFNHNIQLLREEVKEIKEEYTVPIKNKRRKNK